MSSSDNALSALPPHRIGNRGQNRANKPFNLPQRRVNNTDAFGSATLTFHRLPARASEPSGSSLNKPSMANPDELFRSSSTKQEEGFMNVTIRPSIRIQTKVRESIRKSKQTVSNSTAKLLIAVNFTKVLSSNSGEQSTLGKK